MHQQEPKPLALEHLGLRRLVLGFELDIDRSTRRRASAPSVASRRAERDDPIAPARVGPDRPRSVDTRYESHWSTAWRAGLPMEGGHGFK